MPLVAEKPTSIDTCQRLKGLEYIKCNFKRRKKDKYVSIFYDRQLLNHACRWHAKECSRCGAFSRFWRRRLHRSISRAKCGQQSWFHHSNISSELYCNSPHFWDAPRATLLQDIVVETMWMGTPPSSWLVMATPGEFRSLSLLVEPGTELQILQGLGVALTWGCSQIWFELYPSQWRISNNCLKIMSYFSMLWSTPGRWPPVVWGSIFKCSHNRLSTLNGCLMFAERVVIPTSPQQRILRHLHPGHRGVVRMKALARRYVYWPGLTKTLKSQWCTTCSSVAKFPAKTARAPGQLSKLTKVTMCAAQITQQQVLPSHYFVGHFLGIEFLKFGVRWWHSVHLRRIQKEIHPCCHEIEVEHLFSPTIRNPTDTQKGS